MLVSAAKNKFYILDQLEPERTARLISIVEKLCKIADHDIFPLVRTVRP